MNRLLLVFVASLVLPITSHAEWGWPWDVGTQRERAEHAERERDQARGQAGGAGVGIVIIVILAGGVITILARRKRPTITRITRTPAHAVVSDYFAIDGLNVIHTYPKPRPPSLAPLLTLLLSLRSRGLRFKCFFDAVTFYTLRREDSQEAADAYDNLRKDFPDWFVETPGGSQADPFILEFAHANGTPVISNDRYSDFWTIYSWLTKTDAKGKPRNNPERWLNGFLDGDTVVVVSICIREPVSTDIASLVAQLHEKLSQNTHRA